MEIDMTAQISAQVAADSVTARLLAGSTERKAVAGDAPTVGYLIRLERMRLGTPECTNAVRNVLTAAGFQDAAEASCSICEVVQAGKPVSLKLGAFSLEGNLAESLEAHFDCTITRQ